MEMCLCGLRSILGVIPGLNVGETPLMALTLDVGDAAAAVRSTDSGSDCDSDAVVEPKLTAALGSKCVRSYEKI